MDGPLGHEAEEHSVHRRVWARSEGARRCPAALMVVLAACGARDEGDPRDDAPDVVRVDSDQPEDVDTDALVERDPCLLEATTIDIGEGALTFDPLPEGGDLRMLRGAEGGWYLPLSLWFSNSTQAVRLAIDVSDVETGIHLAIDRQTRHVNVMLVVPVLGEAWACEGSFPGVEFPLHWGGLDGDYSVPVWQELCGRMVDVTVSASAPDNSPMGMATKRLRLQPDPLDGPFCE